MGIPDPLYMTYLGLNEIMAVLALYSPRMKEICLRPSFSHYRQSALQKFERQVGYMQANMSQPALTEYGLTSLAIKMQSHSTGDDPYIA
jgi:hypothetical protein